jgi:hypothetical protein
MTTKMIHGIGLKVLQHCRAQNWATLESGISWPIPTIISGQVKLNYVLYRSQVQGREQVIYEPFAQVVVAYPQGDVESHRALPTPSPLKELGRFPYPEIARFSTEERKALWDEMFDAYPAALAAFAGWAAGADAKDLKRFAEIMRVVIPPYMKEVYRSLNPQFFVWLEKLARDLVPAG